MSNFAYMDMPLQIGFQYAGPLDKYAQFESMEEANDWLAGALSYDGALIRVKDKTVTRIVETGENDEGGNPITEEKVTTTWKTFKVELVDNNKVFKPAADIEVVDGKISNANINTTVNCAEAGKIVETNAQGFVDHALLNVTANEVSGYGKVVITNKSGLVDPALLGGVTVNGGADDANKLVKTNSSGLISDEVLGGTTVTGGEGNSGKIVKTNSNGLVDPAILGGVTVEGGEGKSGQLVQVSNTGKIDPSLIPSVALGEFLGTYKATTDDEGKIISGWVAFDSAIKNNEIHAPENGDTVAIEEDNGKGGVAESVYICVNDQVDSLQGKFTTIKSAAGAVSEADFQSHKTDTVIHITSNERTKWNAKLDVEDIKAGTNSTGVEIDVTDDGESVTIDATILPATDSTIGGVIVGENINVENGEISVATASADTLGLVQVGENINVENGVISVDAATTEKLGLVKVGTYLAVDSDGFLNVKTATSTSHGILKAGGTLTVNDEGVVNVNEDQLHNLLDNSYYMFKEGETQEDWGLTENNLDDELLGKINGVIDWYDGGNYVIADASKDSKGIVQVGNNINVDGGVISVATANGTSIGLVKQGTNVTIGTDGAVSVATANGTSLGLVKQGTNVTINENGEVSVATATDDTLGLVKIGSGLDIADDGTVSANILWTKENFELVAVEGNEKANKYKQWEKVCEVKIFDENGCAVFPAEYIVKDGKTRIEFPADFPAEDDGDTAKWTLLVGPAIQ